jgi:hypothetical protein
LLPLVRLHASHWMCPKCLANQQPLHDSQHDARLIGHAIRWSESQQGELDWKTSDQEQEPPLIPAIPSRR